ncbi:MAG: Holliday junction branch migration protein RuvA [Firmicutes bacterium]|nr:Holliday junction branch migration protein RuvA [Bacillota bacterium]
MIYHLEGIVDFAGKNLIVIDVGGVGYGAFVPERMLEKGIRHGESLKLYTYTHVREDEISIYGFDSAADREIFKMIIQVSGIGPKIALSILSVLPAERFARTVQNEDSATLLKIPGIGKKTAQRIILEIKEKVKSLLKEELESNPEDQIMEDAVSTLVGLGCTPHEAEHVVREARLKLPADAGLEKIISEGLEILNAGRVV